MPQVTEKRRLRWKAMLEWGDKLKIEKKYNISNDAVGRCIKTGKGSTTTIDAINEYYGLEIIYRNTNDIDNDN